MSPAIITLIILAVVAYLFISEVIPVPLTAMICSAVLVLCGIMKPAEVAAGFSNSTVLLLCSMLVVGGALFETGVTAKIARAAVKIAKTERQMILVVFLIAALLSSMLSNSGTVAIIIPLTIGIETSVGFSASRLMMASFLGAMCGGRLTLVGDAVINTLAQSAVQNVGGTFGFLDIGKIGLPLTILTGAWLYFYGYKMIPARPISEDADIYKGGDKKQAPLWHQVMSLIIILGVFLGMAFETQLKVPLYWISMLGAILVCTLRILKGKQVYSLIDLKTVFLFVGMLPLGTALAKTGAAKMIAGVISFLVGGSDNIYLITTLVFFVTCFMTQFASNLVTLNLVIPIVVALAATLHVSPIALIMTATIASTNSYLTPVACPPATLIYGTGGFKFTDYAKSNWAILIMSFVMCLVLLPILWPL